MSFNSLDRRVFLKAAGAAGLAGALSPGCAVFDMQGWQSVLGDAIGTGAKPLPRLKPGDGAGIDEKWFEDFIGRFVKSDSSNCMTGEFEGEILFKDSLVGFSPGSDDIFQDYKKIIGPFHQTPLEVMEWAANEQGVSAPALGKISVVSFILPLSDAIVDDNASQYRWCSARWAQGRLYGEIACQKLTMNLLAELADRGVPAVAPDLMPNFRKKRYPEVGWASPWSHRHMAYACGLGSFGMNDFFISEMGSAHRCGSIAVALPLEPNRKRLPHYRHNCLHYQTGGCLVCAERCPVGATSEAGHNKDKCSNNVLSNLPRNQLVNKVNIYGCGLCATATPCSQESPV